MPSSFRFDCKNDTVSSDAFNVAAISIKCLVPHPNIYAFMVI